MKKIGVLLAGSGFLDGAEIREAVLTLLAIDKYDGEAIIFAPNINQADVINHLKQEPVTQTRNVLKEAARIARGEIQDIEKIDAHHLDALIIPGGFGVAKTLSSFATSGENGDVIPQVKTLIKQMHQQQKPIGGICISPAIIALALKDQSLVITLGKECDASKAITNLGSQHQEKEVFEICLDEKNKIVTTPAYMANNPRLKDVFTGIDACVKTVLEWS